MINRNFLNFFQSKFNEILLDKCGKVCYNMSNLRIDNGTRRLRRGLMRNSELRIEKQNKGSGLLPIKVINSELRIEN